MADLKEAMRSGEVVRRDTIRFLRSALKDAQIARVQFTEEPGQPDTVARSPDRDRPLSDDEELAVLRRQIKQRQDSIEQFQRANRTDLVERESGQLAVLRTYLPAGMSQEELDALVRAVIAETGAAGPKDMKLVMPLAIQRAGDRAESRAISEAARRLLAPA